MSVRWAVCLALSDAPAAGRLRLRPGVEVYCEGQTLWLRGGEGDETLTRELSKLPASQRYFVSTDGRLTRVGACVPKGTLPVGPWTPLAEWLVPQPQTAALAGTLTRRVALRLVRATQAREPNLLRTTIEEWKQYADAAPQVRLERLRFALAADGRALVWGQPLPPLPGTRYVEDGGLAAPCGFAWHPPVGAAALREALGMSPEDLTLLEPDGTCERVEAAAWARATRAAVRLSWRRRHETGRA